MLDVSRMFALRSYFTPSLITILFLGFSSGLPLGLTGATLAFWLADDNISKSAIGFMGAVATPYSLKFVWAPIIDSLPAPLFTRLLGRRRGWILLTQLMLMATLFLLALAQPEVNMAYVILFSAAVAFFSASQDIVIDAYRIERLTTETQGQGAAMATLGYQLGMIAAGAGAFAVSKRVGWGETYLVMYALMSIGIITTLMCKEPTAPADIYKRKRNFSEWLKEAVIAPFSDFMRHPEWRLILGFIIVYKFADAFLGRMTSPFFHDMRFDKDDIASVVKLYGVIATMAGLFVGGSLVKRYGTIRIMFVAGLLHALTNLLYVEQARLGADVHFLAFSIAVENFSGGISSVAFVAYLSGLCDVHYTGTQYALLSSLAAFGRTWLATPSGIAVDYLGWEWFFALSALLALPGLILLKVLNKRLTATSLPEAAT